MSSPAGDLVSPQVWAAGTASHSASHSAARGSPVYDIPAFPTSEEIAENLRKDRGRRVMDGGDPYEDDLETESAGPLVGSDML